MRLTTQISFRYLLLSVTVMSCQYDIKSKPDISKLVPFTATYVEGDDGHKIYRLTITEVKGMFSAEEISTDNYSVPKTLDTLKLLQLNERQISKATKFLITACELPSKCDQKTSVTQQLSIDVENKKIEIQGNCEWNEASYFSLRGILFKLNN